MASDYTDGLAMKAVKMVFDYPPSAYENGAGDPTAREKMANAFLSGRNGICQCLPWTEPFHGT